MTAPSFSEETLGLLARALGCTPGRLQWQAVGGGSINQAFRLKTGNGATYFCKTNSAGAFPRLFEKEQQGLERLRNTGAIRVPRPVLCTRSGGLQLLVLEWVESATPNEQFWATFGTQLAALHRVSSDRFGLDHPNYMGNVPQDNAPEPDWTTFFIRKRLQPMVARCSGLLSPADHKRFEQLYLRLPGIFPEEAPPSLLHGDLWSGNFMCSKEVQPVLIDPAVYFGHRSMDLAMTTLFGGFARPFYEAYHHHFPLPANYREQWSVCNLYPLLIHLLLFGKSYLPQIQQTLLACT